MNRLLIIAAILFLASAIWAGVGMILVPDSCACGYFSTYTTSGFTNPTCDNISCSDECQEIPIFPTQSLVCTCSDACECFGIKDGNNHVSCYEDGNCSQQGYTCHYPDMPRIGSRYKLCACRS